jgi:hypothetical protein
MRRLSLLTLVFALLFTVFFLLLILFRVPFLLYPLMSYQDAIDLLTPLVLIPLYWILFRSAASESHRAEELAFLVLASVWVLGHGMHLAANSIDNLTEALARKQVVDITKTDIYALTYFYDERLSHYVWHLGILGLAALLIYHEWRWPAGITTVWWSTVLAGLVHGVTFSLVVLEGQTVPLGFPFALLIVLVTVVRGRQRLGRQPLLAFFFVAFLVASLLLTGWGLYWGGFPQPLDVLGG